MSLIFTLRHFELNSDCKSKSFYQMPYIWFTLDTVDLSASNVWAYFGLQLSLICPIFDRTNSSRFHIPLGYHCAWTQRPFIVFSEWGHTILLFYCSKSMMFYMNWIWEQSLLFIIWQQYKWLTFILSLTWQINLFSFSCWATHVVSILLWHWVVFSILLDYYMKHYQRNMLEVLYIALILLSALRSC